MSAQYRGGGGYYGYNDQYPYDYPRYYDNQGGYNRRQGGGGYRRNYVCFFFSFFYVYSSKI